MSEQLKRMGTSARHMLKQAANISVPLQPTLTRANTFAVLRLEDHIYQEYVTTMAIVFEACVLGALHLLAGPNEDPNPNAVFFGMFLPFTIACGYVFRTVAKEWFRHKETRGSDIVQFFADLSSSMALFLGPMAASLRLLNLHTQSQLLAFVTMFFLMFATFVPLGNLVCKKFFALHPAATISALAGVLLWYMVWKAVESLASTPSELQERSDRWFGWGARLRSLSLMLAAMVASRLQRWVRSSSERHAEKVKAVVAAWASAASVERAAFLLAADGKEGGVLRMVMVVWAAVLTLGLLASDLHAWWCLKFPLAALRLHKLLDDTANAVTMRTSAALEEEKARSHVRESKLGSRVLELLSVISRKDEILNSQARTLQTMETSLLNAQVQQQILTEQLEELRERVDDDHHDGSDESDTAPGPHLRRRSSKKGREKKEQEQRERELRGNQAEVRTHKRTLPLGPPTPMHRQQGAAAAGDGERGGASDVADGDKDEPVQLCLEPAEERAARRAKRLPENGNSNGDKANGRTSSSGSRSPELKSRGLLAAAAPPSSLASGVSRGGSAASSASSGRVSKHPPRDAAPPRLPSKSSLVTPHDEPLPRRSSSGPAATASPEAGGRERSFSLASTLLEPHVQSALEATGQEQPQERPQQQPGTESDRQHKTGPDPRPIKFSERFGQQRGGGEGWRRENSSTTAGISSASTATFSQRTFGESSMLGVIQVKIPLSEQEENLLRLEVEEKEQEVQSLTQRVNTLERLLADATGNKPLPLLPRAGALERAGQSFRWFRGQGWEGQMQDMKHKSPGSYKIRRHSMEGEEPKEKKDKKDKDKAKAAATDAPAVVGGAENTTEADKASAGRAPADDADRPAGPGAKSSKEQEAGASGAEAASATAKQATSGKEAGTGHAVRLAFAAPMTNANGVAAQGPVAALSAEAADAERLRPDNVTEGEASRRRGGDGSEEVEYGREGGKSGRIDDFYLLAQLIGMDDTEQEEEKTGTKTLYFY